MPYVALALRAFWDAGPRAASAATAPRDRFAPPSSLGADLWKKIGGVRGAIARHADSVFARLASPDRLIAEEILLRLSTTDGTSTAIPWDEDELAGTFRRQHRRGATRPRHAGARAPRAPARHHGRAGARGHRRRLASSGVGAPPEPLAAALPRARARGARVAWERSDRAPDLLLQGALFEELRAHPDRAARGLTAADRDLVRASRRRARLRTGAKIFGVLAGVAGVAPRPGRKEMVDAARESGEDQRAAAVELERTAELAAKSRRTEDPFRKAAFATAAMERGSPDGMLPSISPPASATSPAPISSRSST